MKTLLINAHPDFPNHNHLSLQLQEMFLKKFRARFPNDEPTILNLYDQFIPRIASGQLQTIWGKQLIDEPLSESETKIAQVSTALLSQFKAHQRIVLVLPLHNFNIPSALKDYIDNIMIARETFKYTDQPDKNGKASIGLMTNDYKLLVLYASGSIYTKNDVYQTLDFAPQYLKGIFQEVMGFDSFNIVRAEGTATLPEPVILTAAEKKLNAAFDVFY